MTLYSSREPFNDDPEPYVTYADDRRTDVRSKDWDMQSDGAVEYVRVHDPRPEYNRPQNNPTNPILVELRRSDDYTCKVSDYLEYLSGDVYDWRGLDSEKDHARKVLTRLAAFKEES